MDPARGQAGTEGKMGEAPLPRQEVRISWEAHELDLHLEVISKRVKKAKEKQLVPAIVTWREGGFTETKLSSNASRYSGTPKTERAESRMTWCSVKNDHRALPVLVYFSVQICFSNYGTQVLTPLVCHHLDIQIFV